MRGRGRSASALALTARGSVDALPSNMTRGPAAEVILRALPRADSHVSFTKPFLESRRLTHGAARRGQARRSGATRRERRAQLTEETWGLGPPSPVPAPAHSGPSKVRPSLPPPHPFPAVTPSKQVWRSGGRAGNHAEPVSTGSRGWVVGPGGPGEAWSARKARLLQAPAASGLRLLPRAPTGS